MKAKLLAIAAVALLLQTAAQAGPFRTVTATPGAHTIEIPKGMAVTVTNFVHGQTTPGTNLSVQFDSDAPIPVLLATSSQGGNPETQKDFVIAAKGADGKQRVLKLILGVYANDVAVLTYKVSAN
jgi:hypothetical protein